MRLAILGRVQRLTEACRSCLSVAALAAVEKKLSAPRRASLHLRVGEALERRYGGNLEAFAGELALHFESGGEEARGKAICCRQMAGVRSLKACAFEDGFEQFHGALALGEAGMADQERAGLLSGLGQSQQGLSDYRAAVENMASAFNPYVQRGDLARAFQVAEHPYLPAEMSGLGVTPLLERAIAMAVAARKSTTANWHPSKALWHGRSTA